MPRSRRTPSIESWVRAQRTPIVVKASGLAAGKGVVICESHRRSDRHRAQHVRRPIRRRRRRGRHRRIPARRRSQLHRHGRRKEHRDHGDVAGSQAAARRAMQGPNTGGMGAYSPAPVVDRAMHERIMREVIEPTIRGLAKDGTPYTGFLYAGIMVHPDGTPNVLEYNCRFGDPETQPILMRLQERPGRAVRSGARQAARRCARATGIRAPRSASCSRPAAIRTPCARAT